MKSKQPVFVIRKHDVEDIFDFVRREGIIPHPVYYTLWGTLQSKEDLLSAIDSIKYDENNEALISTVHETIMRFESNKLLPHTNDELKRYCRKVTQLRRARGDDCLWCHRDRKRTKENSCLESPRRI